jgi:hypothetical protein
MNRTVKLAVMAAALSGVLIGMPVSVEAQQRGGGGRDFDPAQMRERMMERYKEALGVESDEEWKAIQPRVQKVTQARREVTAYQMRGMMGGFGGRRGGGNGDEAGQSERRRGFGQQPSPAAEELQKAVESKASAETIKAKLTTYREERKQKEAALDNAQDELRKVLSVRQEAAAVLAGLLD